MQPGFLSRIVFAATNQDGRNWKLTRPMVYLARDGRIFIVPVGASTDGASTPAIIQSFLPPTGDYWQSAVLHDAAYQNTLLLLPAGQRDVASADLATGAVKADLGKDDCDELLREAMELSGVCAAHVALIYQGVQVGGSWAYRNDRS